MYNQGMSETATLEQVKPLTQIDTPNKIRLSVPLLIAYFKRGYNESQIANVCNISRQAVNDYVSRHYTELEPMLESDGYLAVRCKYIAVKAQDRILEHLDSTGTKDLMALNAISGTHIDKYGKLTGIPDVIDIRAVTADITGIIKQCQDKLAVDDKQTVDIPTTGSDDGL